MTTLYDMVKQDNADLKAERDDLRRHASELASVVNEIDKAWALRDFDDELPRLEAAISKGCNLVRKYPEDLKIPERPGGIIVPSDTPESPQSDDPETLADGGGVCRWTRGEGEYAGLNHASCDTSTIAERQAGEKCPFCGKPIVFAEQAEGATE